MKKHDCVRLIIATIICIIELTAPHSHANTTQEFKFRHITVENGLSCNNVRALLQDKYGFIWIGTDYSINKYDGYKITRPKGMRHNATVQSLCENGDTIWIGCNIGLLFYSHQCDSITLMSKKTKNGTSINSIVSGISKDDKGNIWISTMEQGIFMLSSKGELTQYDMPGKEKNVADILVTSNGEVWAISNWCKNNLARLNRSRNMFEAVTPVFSSPNEIKKIGGICITQDKSGLIWIGTWIDGVICLNPKDNTARTVIKGEKNSLRHIHKIEVYDKTKLLIGSDDGLSVYDIPKDSLITYKEDELNRSSLSDKFVYPILKDKEGGIWVGTFYGGLNYAHPQSGDFHNHTKSNYLNSVNGNIINTFTEDDGGNIWIASDDGGLSVYNKTAKSFFSYDKGTGSRMRNVHALCIDGYTLYIGTYTNGIDILNIKTGQEKHLQSFKDENGMDLGSSSYAIYKDSRGTIWVGTFNSILNMNKDKGLFTKKRDTETTVISIEEDKDGCMWFATDGKGVHKYDVKRKKWTLYNRFHADNNKDDNTVTNSLYVDQNGIIWVGTSNGLFSYDKKKDAFNAVETITPTPNVLGVTGDKRSLWLTTSHGLIKYSIKGEKTERVFNSGDGLDNINFIQNAIYKSTDGTIYLGTSHGFTSFSPDKINTNVYEPKIVFTDFEIFNKPISSVKDGKYANLNNLKDVRLSHKENSIKLSFAALSYVTSENNRYQFYLEGYEKDWNNPTTEHSVTYTNLEPGDYVFHVRASNNDGVWNDDGTYIKIVITPPFYWNTPVRCLYFVILIAAFWLIIKTILRKKEKQHVAEIEQLNEKNEQEVHEARIKFMTISDSDNEFLKKLESVIENNFSNPDISVDFLASEMNVSRSGLFAKVKNLADITPNEMIQIIRLKHAAKLLEAKKYRVNEICYMVGFNSPSYFSKCFTKHYGVKPAEYAK